MAAYAAYAALAREADSARAQGDPRTKGQVMADGLVDRVLVVAEVHKPADPQTQDDTAPSPDDEPPDSARPGTSRTARGSIALNLVMSQEALFGATDDDARLAGFGPIPAELAREIVANALGQDEEVWLRRLYASPTTGELVAMDSRARLFPAGLARFIRLRDQVCRTPWCDAPIRHIDHVRRHAGVRGRDAGGVGRWRTPIAHRATVLA